MCCCFYNLAYYRPTIIPFDLVCFMNNIPVWSDLSNSPIGIFTLLTSREKSRSFSFTKLRDFLVGSAHVRSQATVHAFMHAAHAVCMRAEDIPTEVPKVT